jgi:hypothetical protein|nr:MAG TPA: hypothetical protein [Caudoviricetes sp.]
MLLTEITVIKPSNRLLYKSCDELCFLSKNLYNSILYIHRRRYQDGKSYIGHFDMISLLREQENFDYYALPKTMPGDYVAKQVHEDYKILFIVTVKERR